MFENGHACLTMINFMKTSTCKTSMKSKSYHVNAVNAAL